MNTFEVSYLLIPANTNWQCSKKKTDRFGIVSIKSFVWQLMRVVICYLGPIMRAFCKLGISKIRKSSSMHTHLHRPSALKTLKKRISIRNPMNPRMQKNLDAIPCQIAKTYYIALITLDTSQYLSYSSLDLTMQNARRIHVRTTYVRPPSTLISV